MKRNNVLKKAFSNFKKRKKLAMGVGAGDKVRAPNRKKTKSLARSRYTGRSTKQAA